MKNILPVGSVVVLKGKNARKVMIAGYHTKTKDGKIFDYFTVPYPMGLLAPSEYLLINEKLIDSVVFEGYRTPESDSFSQGLRELEENLGTLMAELKKEEE